MEQNQPKVCPFTLRAPEKSSVIMPGQPPQTVQAVPCLGPACVAFTPIADESGRVVGGDCRLCMGPSILTGVVQMLSDSNHLTALGLQKIHGIEVPNTDVKKEAH